MSPNTSYACSSNSYDVQSEKLSARAAKSSSNSSCPVALRHAPSTLTGSLRDQSARRGAASPLCSSSSASYRLVLTQSRKSSRSATSRQSIGHGPIGSRLLASVAYRSTALDEKRRFHGTRSCLTRGRKDRENYG